MGLASKLGTGQPSAPPLPGETSAYTYKLRRLQSALLQSATLQSTTLQS